MSWKFGGLGMLETIDRMRKQDQMIRRITNPRYEMEKVLRSSSAYMLEEALRSSPSYMLKEALRLTESESLTAQAKSIDLANITKLHDEMLRQTKLHDEMLSSRFASGLSAFQFPDLTPHYLKLTSVLEDATRAARRLARQSPSFLVKVILCEGALEQAYNGDKAALIHFTVDVLGLDEECWSLVGEVLAGEDWQASIDPLGYIRGEALRLWRENRKNEKTRKKHISLNTGGPQGSPLEVRDSRQVLLFQRFELNELILHVAQRVKLSQDALAYLLLKIDGATQEAAAARLGWDKKKSERVRKEIERSRFSEILLREFKWTC